MAVRFAAYACDAPQPSHAHIRQRKAIPKQYRPSELDFIHFSTTAESSRERVRVCNNRYLWWAVRVVGPILAHRVTQCQFLDITLIA